MGVSARLSQNVNSIIELCMLSTQWYLAQTQLPLPEKRCVGAGGRLKSYRSRCQKHAWAQVLFLSYNANSIIALNRFAKSQITSFYRDAFDFGWANMRWYRVPNLPGNVDADTPFHNPRKKYTHISTLPNQRCVSEWVALFGKPLLCHNAPLLKGGHSPNVHSKIECRHFLTQNMNDKVNIRSTGSTFKCLFCLATFILPYVRPHQKFEKYVGNVTKKGVRQQRWTIPSGFLQSLTLTCDSTALHYRSTKSRLEGDLKSEGRSTPNRRGDPPQIGGATHPDSEGRPTPNQTLSRFLCLAQRKPERSLCKRERASLISVRVRDREHSVRGGSPIRFGVGRPSESGWVAPPAEAGPAGLSLRLVS